MQHISNQVCNIVEKIANNQALTPNEISTMNKWVVFKLRTDYLSFFTNKDHKKAVQITTSNRSNLNIFEILHNNPQKVIHDLTIAMHKSGINPNDSFTLPVANGKFMLIPVISSIQAQRCYNMFAEIQHNNHITQLQPTPRAGF